METKQTNSSLVSACWLLTSKCNYACSFCFKVPNQKDITYQDAERVLKDLVNNGVKKISFSGGEPLLWSGNILKLIALAKSYGILTMMITNGSLLTDEKLLALKNNLDWITLPLDGSNEEKQVKAGRPPEHFTRTIKILEKLNNSKFNIKINTVLSKQNIDDIENIAQLIKKYNVKRWKVFQFFPVRAASLINKQRHEISIELFRNKENHIKSLFTDSECLVYFGSNTDLETSYFTISPNGTAYITKNGVDFPLGDLKIKPVKEVWGSADIIDKKKYLQRAAWFIE